MSAITFDIEGRAQVVNAMERTADKLGIPIKWLAIDQLRLLLIDLIKFLPPASKKQGESAVGYDISRVIQPMTATEISAVRELNPVGAVLAGGRIVTAKSGAVWLVSPEDWAPHAGEDEVRERHQGHRNSRGRVPESAGRVGMQIGRAHV